MALLFSGIDFESETKTTFGATKVAPIDPNPCLVYPLHFLASSQGFTSSKTKLNSGFGRISEGGQAAGGILVVCEGRFVF